MKFFLNIFLVCIFNSALFAQIDHWESAVLAENIWSYQEGTAQVSDQWREANYDDSSWSTGPGGIGYGDDDDATIIDPVISLFMRHRFQVVDKSAIERILFHADYDDGFVAYLNGVEIARSNVSGEKPAYDIEADQLREAQVYQGGVPLNFQLNPNVLQDVLQEGENVLAIQTHNFDGTISSDLSSLYFLSFGINDNSANYQEPPSWFNVISEFTSPLPIVSINTFGQEIPDEPKVQAEMTIHWNGSEGAYPSSEIDYHGNIAIELRGQSSQFFFPKKNYAFETRDSLWEDEDVSLLGFPEEEDWILHGPYSDKTLMRNVLAMDIARSMGQYASRTRYVELMLNEDYRGIYVLMEKIKRDDGRVDLASLKPEDVSGDELTGGYVFKVDKGDPDWQSNYNMLDNNTDKLSFQYVSPSRSKIVWQQENYIQSYVDSFENALKNSTWHFAGKHYTEFMDNKSFAEHYIIKELSKDVDAYRISSYYYKDKDSNDPRIKAGPVWDFNLGFGNVDYCQGAAANGWAYDYNCGIANPFWWERLRENPEYMNAFQCRWKQARSGPLAIDSLFAFIDEKVALLEPAITRNYDRWPILNQYVWPNAEIPGSYAGEINYLKDFLMDRIEWMDNSIGTACDPTSIFEISNTVDINVSPNPSTDNIAISISGLPPGKLKIDLINLLGTQVLSTIEADHHVGKFNHQQIINLTAGIYFLRVNLDGALIGTKRVLVR